MTGDSDASDAPERIDATNMMEVAAEMGTTSAESCMSTCCKTFHSKKRGDSPPVPKVSRAELSARTKQP